MFQALLRDENGFIVSAELVLVATLTVIGLVVGLSEVQHSVVAELNDVGDAIGSLNQGYSSSGFSAYKSNGCLKAASYGSAFGDSQDDCDNDQCQISCDSPVAEQPKGGRGHGRN